MTAPPRRPKTPDPSTLSLPRLLCLHGGGTNAAIFQNQMRAVMAHPSLVNRYRFVYIDAPFECDEGVGVRPVYSDWGPFRRWSRWLSNHPPISDEEASRQIFDVLDRAIDEDQGWGEWVAVLGFSQGAKLAASMLYEQQLRLEKDPKKRVGWGNDRAAEFKFALVMAGRAPFVALSEESQSFPWMQKAGGLVDDTDLDSIDDRPDMKLKLPTVHVHGLKDEGLRLHRRMVDNYCAPMTPQVVEWDGGHRVPIKKADVDKTVEKLVEVAEEYGV